MRWKDRAPRLVMGVMPALFIALTMMTGCFSAEPELGYREGPTLQLSDATAAFIDAPVRLATIWYTASGPVIVDDRAVSMDGNSAEIRIDLQEIDPSRLGDVGLLPEESAQLTERGSSYRAVRPRFVAYIDNGNLQLDDDVFSDAPYDEVADTILGLDADVGQGVSYMPQLDIDLDTMTFLETDLYYRATGDVYTQLVPVFPEGTSLSIQSLGSWLIGVSLIDSPVPLEEVRCNRQPVSVTGSAFSGSLRARVTVDVALDETSICGLSAGQCTSADLSTLDAPELSEQNDAFGLRTAQCRSSENLAVLLIHHALRSCAACICGLELEEEVYIADPASLPDWWPCDDTVDECVSTLPPTVFDARCLVAEDDDTDMDEDGDA